MRNLCNGMKKNHNNHKTQHYVNHSIEKMLCIDCCSNVMRIQQQCTGNF